MADKAKLQAGTASPAEADYDDDHGEGDDAEGHGDDHDHYGEEEDGDDYEGDETVPVLPITSEGKPAN